MNITLICSQGMSTSLLVNRMKQAALQRNLEVTIRATAEGHYSQRLFQSDIILLGPQVRHLVEEYINRYQPRGVKVGVIDMMDYGYMNGEKVLDQALRMVEEE